MNVKDCMSTGVCCAKTDTTIKDVAKLMNDNHIGCIPVCDDQNAICGILTDRDILLRGIACDKDVNTTKASDIMSTNVCTCKENDDMYAAQAKMSEYQIRRLPVCDDNNHVVGIVTLGNLAQNDTSLGKNNVSTTINNICDRHSNTNNG